VKRNFSRQLIQDYAGKVVPRRGIEILYLGVSRDTAQNTFSMFLGLSLHHGVPRRPSTYYMLRVD
jgi:hypothetical protein